MASEKIDSSHLRACVISCLLPERQGRRGGGGQNRKKWHCADGRNRRKETIGWDSSHIWHMKKKKLVAYYRAAANSGSGLEGKCFFQDLVACHSLS